MTGLVFIFTIKLTAGVAGTRPGGANARSSLDAHWQTAPTEAVPTQTATTVQAHCVPTPQPLRAPFVCLRGTYTSLFCQLSVYTLCPCFYRAGLLHDLQWRFQSQKRSPLSDRIPISSTHSDVVSICATPLKLLSPVASDLQMGLSPNETLSVLTFPSPARQLALPRTSSPSS